MPSIIIRWCTVELIFWGRSRSSLLLLLLLLLLLHKDIRTNYYYQSIDYYYYYDTPTYAVIYYYTTGTTEKTRLLTGTRPYFGLPIQRDPLFRVVYYRYSTVSYRINKNVHLNGRRSAAESSSVRHVQNTVLRVARSPRSGRRGPRVSPQRVRLSVRRCYNIRYTYNRYIIIIIIISITPSNLFATTRPRRRP
jgi:hypothetical protein